MPLVAYMHLCVRCCIDSEAVIDLIDLVIVTVSHAYMFIQRKMYCRCCAGMLANGGLLELHDGLGGLSLNANSLAASGINGQQAQRVGMSSKPIISDQLTRNSITTMGSNTSSNTMASSLPLSQGVSQGNGLPFGWISMADPEGRVFYFHGLTGVAQWHAPLTQ